MWRIKKTIIASGIAILIALGCLWYFKGMPASNAGIRLNQEKLQKVSIRYMGDNEHLLSSIEKAGAKIDRADSLTTDQYNVFIIEKEYISKLDENSIKNLVLSGKNVFFNDITNTKEISNKILQVKSYEVLRDQKEDSKTLLKLYKDSADALHIMMSSYSLYRDKKDYIHLLAQILEFSEL